MTPPFSRVETRRTRHHLLAASISIGLLCATVLGGGLWAARMERTSFRSLLPAAAAISRVKYFEHLKNQGTVVQRLAFEQSDELPLYGSSELVKEIPDKASSFFRDFPTGFSVFPVGKAGSTTFIILQRLAALGEATRGKRVAISLSPTWFYTNNAEGHYNGNVSAQQELASLLNGGLSPSFRREMARRLLAHPKGMSRDALLHFLCVHMAQDGWLDRVSYCGVWPISKLREAVYSAQDHFETCFYIQRHTSQPDLVSVPSKSGQIDWDRLLAEAVAESKLSRAGPKAPKDYPDGSDATQSFENGIEHSSEWDDLDFLVRGLHELGVKALILCMPPNGFFLERGGISRESLTEFTNRIRAVGGRYGASVELFEDHLEDSGFRSDEHDHLSAAGWMYYNRSLDAFYHNDLAFANRGPGASSRPTDPQRRQAVPSSPAPSGRAH